MNLKRTLSRAATLTIALIAAFSLAAQDKSATSSPSDSNHNSIGFIASKDATAKDVGLPLYPGAKRQSDEPEDSSALLLGLWAGSSDFRVVVLKMTSDDTADKVAAFYRKALAKYGRVLDCSGSQHVTEGGEKDPASNDLDCGQDQPEHGGILLKSGVKKDQHVVAVNQNGNHTSFQLAYVRVPR